MNYYYFLISLQQRRGQLCIINVQKNKFRFDMKLVIVSARAELLLLPKDHSLLLFVGEAVVCRTQAD